MNKEIVFCSATDLFESYEKKLSEISLHQKEIKSVRSKMGSMGFFSLGLVNPIHATPRNMRVQPTPTIPTRRTRRKIYKKYVKNIHFLLNFVIIHSKRIKTTARAVFFSSSEYFLYGTF